MQMYEKFYNFADTESTAMIDETLKNRILALIKREVVPAVGCTEPVAVALAAARAAELLGVPRAAVERVECRLSGNIIKNAMGVGIPGTGMIGLPIAVALGVIAGRSELSLEVLADVTPEAVEQGKAMIARKGCIDIALEPHAPDILYIDVYVYIRHVRSSRAATRASYFSSATAGVSTAGRLSRTARARTAAKRRWICRSAPYGTSR